MTIKRRPLDSFAVCMMLILCACWGFQQVAIKLVAGDVSPVLQIALRSALGALILGAITFYQEGRHCFGDGTLGAGMAVGFLFGLEFLLVAEALVYTKAAHVVVFVYTAPIFTALGLHVLIPEERLTGRQWLGVAVAFGGIVVALLAQSGARAANVLLGDSFALSAGLAWGATTVAIRRTSLSETAPAKTLFYQLAAAGVMLLGVVFATHDTRFVPSVPALASLAFQTIVVTSASLLVWFWLLRRYFASRLSIFSLLTPVFGVTFSVLILHEQLTPSFLAGGALVVCGIGIVSGMDLMRLRMSGMGSRT